MENAAARMVRGKDTIRHSIRRTLRSGVTVQPAPHTRFLTVPLGSLAGDDRPVLRPVELERLAGHERQGHENTTAGGLLLSLPSRLPVAGKGGHAIVRT